MEISFPIIMGLVLIISFFIFLYYNAESLQDQE
jgi:hypothetical protein